MFVKKQTSNVNKSLNYYSDWCILYVIRTQINKNLSRSKSGRTRYVGVEIYSKASNCKSQKLKLLIIFRYLIIRFDSQLLRVTRNSIQLTAAPSDRCPRVWVVRSTTEWVDGVSNHFAGTHARGRNPSIEERPCCLLPHTIVNTLLYGTASRSSICWIRCAAIVAPLYGPERARLAGSGTESWKQQHTLRQCYC